MRKLICIFLVLVMTFSLCGCQKKQASPAPLCSLEDFLVYQSIHMARKISMSAEESYCSVLIGQDDLCELAGTFAGAVNAKPVGYKLTSTSDADIVNTLLTFCSQHSNRSMQECCQALAFSTQFHFERTLTQTSMVLLKYDDGSTFIVVFTPLQNNLISAYAYPLSSSVATLVDRRFFKNINAVAGDQILKTCMAAFRSDSKSTHTGAEVNTAYYADLAKSVFANSKTLSTQDIGPHKVSSQVKSQLMLFSKLITSGIGDTTVYYFPSDVQTKVDSMLENTSYPKQLQALTQQRAYLSWIYNISGLYGADNLTANSLLRVLLDTTHLGLTAQANEVPVVVAMEITNATLLMAIYPSENNTYLYAYVCLPCAYTDAQNHLVSQGATPMA